MAIKLTTEVSDEPSLTVLESFSEELHAIADALTKRGGAQRKASDMRIRVAKRALEDRLLRHAHFPHHLFGEPGWHILLDLFVSEDLGRPISVSSAIIACGAPATTAARWIDELVELSLIARHPHPSDRRSTVIELTADGRNAIKRWADDTLSRERPTAR